MIFSVYPRPARSLPSLGKTWTLTLLTGAGLLIASAGCVSPKKMIYFQDVAGAMPGAAGIDSLKTYVPTIRPGDVLSVQVSSLSPEASAIFNPYAIMGNMNTRQSQVTTPVGLPEMTGYLVSPAGQIELPLVGAVPVGGMTISNAGRTIREKLQTYLKEPTVNVRNLNFRVSVLGEVARPALFTIPNDRITLLEALSLAGDATIYGRRDNVLVVREENGHKVFGRVDLTSREMFRSPYFYLHPNDVVYIEPSRGRIANSDQFYQSGLAIILSGLSILAIILTRK